VSYKVGGKVSDKQIPASAGSFDKDECVYETMPGWQRSTVGITDFAKLPQKAQDYMRYLEQKTGARVGMISTGPDRDQTIFLDEFAAAIHAREMSARRA